MNTELLFAKVNSPKVPQFIVDNALEIVDKLTEYNKDKLQKIPTVHPIITDCCTLKTFHYPLSEEAYQWAKENVTSEFSSFKVWFSLPGMHVLPPHTDNIRNYSLLYLLQSGDDHHSTVFYKEKNKDILLQDLQNSGITYDNIEELARIQIPLNQWVIINSNVIHSIELISKGRITVQLGCLTIPKNLNLTNKIYAEL